jgi:beta-glucosidase/6-phospho-beta-glucosidase/beta-galactosidase
LGVEQHRAAGHLDGVELIDPPPGRLDYLGVNYYRQETVSARSEAPFDWRVTPRPGVELTEMGWRSFR